MAVSLLSMAVVGVIPLVWANVRGSSLQNEMADARRWVVTAGDFATAKADPAQPPNTGGLSYVDCATPTDYEGPLRTATGGSYPTTWTAAGLTVSKVWYWDGNTFGPTCYAADGLKLQEIFLEAASPDARAHEALEVVKDG
jgi:hypothetical protein